MATHESDFNEILSESELWAPILGRLNPEQVQKVQPYLEQKTSTLEKFQASGTRKQQLHELDRLTKLQKSPFSQHASDKCLKKCIEDRLQKPSDISMTDGPVAVGRVDSKYSLHS